MKLTTNKNILLFISLTRKYFNTYLGIALSVVLFIQFFQPFAIEKFNFENKLLFISGFGLIIIICLLITQILFLNQLADNGNNSPKTAVYLPAFFFSQLVFTSLAFVFYIRYVGQVPIKIHTVVRVVIICLSLPLTINLKNRILTYRQNIKKLKQEAKSLKIKIKDYSESYALKYIEIFSENESDHFRLLVSEIVFAKSADNYVEIGYQEESVVKKKLVRNSLKNIEKQLSEFNIFVRTHRTSLVNIQYIEKLHKSFNTYWLSLLNSSETIPVSRQYLITVKDLL